MASEEEEEGGKAIFGARLEWVFIQGGGGADIHNVPAHLCGAAPR